MAVVVGFVPTREGCAALRRAALECRIRRSPLVVVSSSRSGRNLDPDEARAFEGLLAQVREELKSLGIGYEERQFSHGQEPAEDLLSVAHEIDADCIVIGLRRRTPVGKLLLGSNAQRILLEASCAVLAVKATDEDCGR